jgi:DNA-binding NtrC family response regulator
MNLLTAYRWPGNVRELANVIEHAVVFCRGAELKPEHLPSEFSRFHPAPETGQDLFSLSLPSHSLAQTEAILIRKVLAEKDWNLSQAAEELDIARGTLYSKMQRYGITKP